MNGIRISDFGITPRRKAEGERRKEEEARRARWQDGKEDKLAPLPSIPLAFSSPSDIRLPRKPIPPFPKGGRGIGVGEASEHFRETRLIERFGNSSAVSRKACLPSAQAGVGELHKTKSLVSLANTLESGSLLACFP